MTIMLDQKELREQAIDAINRWSHSALRIENDYRMSKRDISNRDYSFLKILGESVYHINRFNSLLIAFIENSNSLKKNNELHKLSDYSRFFNSLIASKIKYFFFREIPIIANNGPFISNNTKIFGAAIELTNIFNAHNISFVKIESAVFKFFYLQMLLYGFIYENEKEKGYFLTFKYDRDSFNEIYRFLIKNLEEIETEKDIRLLGSNFFGWLAYYYVEKYNSNYKQITTLNSTIHSIEIIKPEVYSNLINVLRNKRIDFEPLTYHFADILWKIDGMIHDDDEYLSVISKRKQEQELVENIKLRLTKILNNFKATYERNKINNHLMYKTESDLIDWLYQFLLKQKDIDEIRTIYSKLNSIHPTYTVKRSNLGNECTITSIVHKLRKFGEKGFKIESVITNLHSDELLYLLHFFVEHVSTVKLNNETEIVGFFKSGVFLGHILNLFLKKNSPIWLFKTKPYVATHPIHKDKYSGKYDSILVLDECTKTNFTYSLYETYLTRNIFGSEISVFLYTLFDFSYYKKIKTVSKLNVHSLINLSNNLIPDNLNNINYLGSYSLNDIKNISFELSENLNYFKKCFEIVKDKNDQIDLTYFLMNTSVYFSICYDFAQKIIKNNKDSEPVLLFAGSSEGEILNLGIAFILKLMNYDVWLEEVVNSKNKLNNYFVVGIDLSFVTGFSLLYKWAIFKYGKYVKVKEDMYINDFDLLLTILSFSSNRDNFNLKSLIYI